ncbi:hypothetical protein K7432_016323 [Basidiobolus ranarum]|uniref:Uncharacterized protein n=1 Tax=Basidiobolus ranarum TaxID=34480 RepID=A0ABR2VLS2_9FUNG
MKNCFWVTELKNLLPFITMGSIPEAEEMYKDRPKEMVDNTVDNFMMERVDVQLNENQVVYISSRHLVLKEKDELETAYHWSFGYVGS